MNLQIYDRLRLGNGLTVVSAPMPNVRSVSIGLYVPVGSRYESQAQSGISHFLEHMLFKGCAGWPSALALANEIEGRGGYVNASTGQEYTSLWIKIGARHWRRALSLLASMAQAPLLDAAEFARERDVILDEIHMYRDLPEDLVGQLSNQALWGDHPLGREIAGEPETVAALDVATLAAFHRRAYRPEGAVLTIAGAVPASEIHAAAAADFGRWQAEGEAPTFEPAPDLPGHPRHRIAIRPSDQAHLQLAVPGLARAHPDRFALSILHALLGDGMSSRLWQRLREQRGLTYNIGSFVNMFADGGVVGVYGGCDPRHLFETLEEVESVWHELQAHLAPPAELQHFKEYIKGRMELSSEDSSAVAAWWGRQIAAGLEPLTLDEALAAIDAASGDDIRRLARQLWQPQSLTLAYVGPLDSQERLQAWLLGRTGWDHAVAASHPEGHELEAQIATRPDMA